MTSRTPPGPTDYLFGMRTLARMKADVVGSYLELQREYGDVVSFLTGPYRLFIFFHPDQVRDVLVAHAKSLIRLPRVMKTPSGTPMSERRRPVRAFTVRRRGAMASDSVHRWTTIRTPAVRQLARPG